MISFYGCFFYFFTTTIHSIVVIWSTTQVPVITSTENVATRDGIKKSSRKNVVLTELMQI